MPPGEWAVGARVVGGLLAVDDGLRHRHQACGGVGDELPNRSPQRWYWRDHREMIDVIE